MRPFHLLAGLLALALLAPACGGVADETEQSGFARARTAPPDTPPLEPAPYAETPERAPSVWGSSGGRSVWLRAGSSCWGDESMTVCGDAAAPVCGEADTPDLAVPVGGALRLHLGRVADSLSIDSTKMRPAETVTFDPGAARDRVLTVVAWFPQGDASWSLCLRP